MEGRAMQYGGLLGKIPLKPCGALERQLKDYLDPAVSKISLAHHCETAEIPLDALETVSRGHETLDASLTVDLDLLHGAKQVSLRIGHGCALCHSPA